MKHQAEGLKAGGVWGFAFTPQTTALGLPSPDGPEALPAHGEEVGASTNFHRVLNKLLNLKCNAAILPYELRHTEGRVTDGEIIYESKERDAGP